MPRVGFDLDLSFMEKTFLRLSSEKELNHIAASTALAGAIVLRDEAKQRAPEQSGTLKNAIYVAHDDKNSYATTQTYAVSWNSRKAPHGHLIEHGHWLVRNGKRLVFVAAIPFLRSAYEAKANEVQRAMQNQANKKLQELINGSTTDSGTE